MTPARFLYKRPATLDAALALLAAETEGAMPLAGGQSLMPMLALRLARPALLIDINRLPGLNWIAVAAGQLRIGALARHADVLADPLVAAHAPLLRLALTEVAHPAIRNRGTLGGSLALADPAAELPACMIALDATIRLRSAARGERSVPAGLFFTGLYGTARAADELLTGVDIPITAGWRPWFGEVSRRHGDFAMAGLAFLARWSGGRMTEARVALLGVEAAPRRLPGVEAAVIAGEDVAVALARDLEPLDSAEVPAGYRLHLAATLLRRAAREGTHHAS